MLMYARNQHNIVKQLTSNKRAAATAHKHSREELPHVQGQGQKPGGTHARSAVTKRSYPTSEVRGGGRTSHPVPEARGSGWEDQPHIQGVVAVWAQEGQEVLSHVEGQEGRQ